jgi:hypothetical protein
MSATEKNLLEPKGRITLKEFIDENDKLLAAMGVMGALAALFTKVQGGEYLASLAFMMLLILDVELVLSFYKSRGRGWSRILIIFETFLEFLIVGVGEFILRTYPAYFEGQFLPIIAGFGACVLAIRAYQIIKSRYRIRKENRTEV